MFVIPSLSGAADIPLKHISRRGYNLIFWQKDHMAFEAVSDMNGKDLESLCRLSFYRVTLVSLSRYSLLPLSELINGRLPGGFADKSIHECCKFRARTSPASFAT